MPADYLLLETEGGLILLEGEDVIFSLETSSDEGRSNAYAQVAEEAKRRGIEHLLVGDQSVIGRLSKFGINAELLPEDEREALESRKVMLIVKAGLAKTQAEAVSVIREGALRTAERVISEESSRPDLHLVQAIQSLDEIDRAQNVASERLLEWYGLHFPELPPIIQDNLILGRMIVDAGRRDQFDEEMLKARGLSQKKIEAILIARDRSKGGSISDRDLTRVKGLGVLVMGLSNEREKLAEYVESAMKKIAPNVGDVAGSTIGARLIAKAGGLDRLARLPASTIQILGAEKALFRALRTGARPPKHGILFQHQAVHTAPKWQRGKIARTIANKVAIAARIDYYRGERDGSLTGLLEKRLAEIRLKYKEPKQAEPSTRKKSFEKRLVRGKRRKEKRRH